MAAALTWTAEDHQGRTVVTLRGRLDTAAATRLCTTLLEQLAGQPEALLLDLSAMAVEDPAALSALISMADRAARWPGTPVLLCAPTPATAALLAGRYAGPPVHCSVAAAHRAVTADPAVTPPLADDLLPLPGAARHARNLTTEACVRWSLPQLAGPAAVVTSELITNAIEHAGTMMTLRLTRPPNGLRIAVADGSTAPPVAAPQATASSVGGRGLHVVAGLAARWGHLPSPTGKVVWAVLPVG